MERFLDPNTPAEPVDFDDPDFRCETIDGTAVNPDIAFAAVAVAEFERVVLGAESRPIDVSVKSRGFPPWVKRALLIAARHGQIVRRLPGNARQYCNPDNKWKRDLESVAA